MKRVLICSALALAAAGLLPKSARAENPQAYAYRQAQVLPWHNGFYDPYWANQSPWSCRQPLNTSRTTAGGSAEPASRRSITSSHAPTPAHQATSTPTAASCRHQNGQATRNSSACITSAARGKQVCPLSV